MKTSLKLIPLLIAGAFALNSGEASARGENELVRLAHTIEDIAAELKEEFRVHYRHSSAYRHLMSDVSEILSEAKHIDGLAHDPRSSLRHLKADLVDLDDLAHHLHEVVDAVERRRYGGHVDGTTRHVHLMLDSLNGTIHRMERVVEAYAAPVRPAYHYDHYESRRSYSSSRGNGRAVAIGAIIGTIIELSRDRDHHCRH